MDGPSGEEIQEILDKLIDADLKTLKDIFSDDIDVRDVRIQRYFGRPDKREDWVSSSKWTIHEVVDKVGTTPEKKEYFIKWLRDHGVSEDEISGRSTAGRRRRRKTRKSKRSTRRSRRSNNLR